MSVQLTPDGQLGFHRPYTQLVKRTLTVSNPNDRPIMFKVKTTAPKQYCVRPNSGRIEPSQRLEVQVLLQPMKEDPPPNTKCRDKFLVQSAVIPKERDTLLMSELWQIVEKEERESIHEQKIRCVYLPPNEQDSVVNATTSNGRSPLSDSSTSPTQNGSPSAPRLSTLSVGHGMSNGDTFQAAQSTMGTSPSSANGPESVLDQLAESAPSAPLAGIAAGAGATAAALGLESDTVTTSSASAAREAKAVPAAATDNAGSLRKDLADARAEIERLKAQLKESAASSSLRQRNVGAAAAPSGTMPVIGHDTQTANIEGVPPKVVMGIALTVFIVTWLFF